jgi:hypothetical protein
LDKIFSESGVCLLEKPILSWSGSTGNVIFNWVDNVRRLELEIDEYGFRSFFYRNILDQKALKVSLSGSLYEKKDHEFLRQKLEEYFIPF